MKKRDYRREYDLYQSRPEQKKNRAKRNLWNRRLKGKVPNGKEIDHRNPLAKGGGNGRANIRYRDIHSNRADKSMLKKAMWSSFEDELNKYAEFRELSELEKRAFLSKAKRGFQSLNNSANELLVRSAYKLGMTPLELIQRGNSAVIAGSAAGAVGGANAPIVLGAGLKNLVGGKILSQASKGAKRNLAKKITSGAENIITEGALQSTLKKNRGLDASTYAMRVSPEAVIDALSSFT